MGDNMVVVFSFDAFARNELLAGRLVSFGGALTTRSSVSTERSSVSLMGRILYRLFDSNTGGGRVEVVKARPETRGGGIFECAIGKVSIRDIKVSDRPTEEESSPVCKSLVVAAESGAQRPILLPASILVFSLSGSVGTASTARTATFLVGQSLLRCPRSSHLKQHPSLRCFCFFSFLASMSMGCPAPPYVFCDTECHRPCVSRPEFPLRNLLHHPAVFFELLVAVSCFCPPGFLLLPSGPCWPMLWTLFVSTVSLTFLIH